jgi:hypothetical protein
MADTIDINFLKNAYSRLKKSTKNFKDLIVRDPINHLDYECELEDNLHNLRRLIERGEYIPKQYYLHESAKSKGITRSTVVFKIEDAIVYRYCIENIEDELFEKVRQNNIRGGIRITPVFNEQGDSFYEKWFEDWREHNNNVHKALEGEGAEYLVTTDISSYFGSISLELLEGFVRSHVGEKEELINLLFYFLEHACSRFGYESNIFVGLPQEDTNCSRVLAYFFLSPHDDRMEGLSRDENIDYFRFVDDMNFVVSDKNQGKRVLQEVCRSLKYLKLTTSIEKTSLLTAGQAKKALFVDENKKLNDLENKLKERIKVKKSYDDLVDSAIAYYEELIGNERNRDKNWNKCLKRFYTFFTIGKSPYFIDYLLEHIDRFPDLVEGKKVTKYLLSLQNQCDVECAAATILKYLNSDKNLYPNTETTLLELLLKLEKSNLGIQNVQKIIDYSEKLFFNRAKKAYTRALACLLAYKFDKINVLKKIGQHYLDYFEPDSLLREYIVFTTLTLNNRPLTQEIKIKAKKDPSIEVKRLMDFIESLEHYKDYDLVKIF